MDALRCEVYATMGSLKSGQTTSETTRHGQVLQAPPVRGFEFDFGNALRRAPDALPSDEQCADDDLWHGHPRPWTGQGNPMMLLQPNPISFRDLP
jgi:hypothetical protein